MPVDFFELIWFRARFCVKRLLLLFFQDFSPLVFAEADELGLDVGQSIALEAHAGAVFAHGVM